MKADCCRFGSDAGGQRRISARPKLSQRPLLSPLKTYRAHFMCAWSAFSLEASRLYVRSVSTGGDADNAEDDQACAICIFCGMTNEMSRTGDLDTDAISFYK